jgi:hypothetical protein
MRTGSIVFIVTELLSCLECKSTSDPKKYLSLLDRTKTDTGVLVENTKALERTMLKELGKMIP